MTKRAEVSRNSPNGKLIFPEGHIGSDTYKNYSGYSDFDACIKALMLYILSLFKNIKRRIYSL